ncbi:MAG: Nif3-like dinuclear metal center hexameric protein [Cytophagales bacterium]|nr:Nif3-like dinuclear metal center hexameric protein [Cytophagales bacterium]MDW8384013.1 Nif3-like dinuclear metal center hexameric protein [Flammeovirgaceae bacterium]
MTTFKEIIEFLENQAPVLYQEKYDNSGFLVGNLENKVTNVLLSLDVTEEIIQEAIQKKCNFIISHHPIIFGGIKHLTGKTYVERCVMQAIRFDIGLYAIHTNLDNLHKGVNAEIARRLDLINTRILAPKTQLLRKLTVFVPHSHRESLLTALSRAGAGQIGNYTDCSFQVEGIGTFRPNEQAHPHIGERGKLETVQEVRLEVIFPLHAEKQVLKSMREHHPYEEIAYYLHSLENEWQDMGSGLVGELREPMEEIKFLTFLAEKMNLRIFKHTALRNRPIQKVALCGGSGSFLLKNAISQGADVFISADFKYHDYFDAESKILIADIGHYESEIFTIELLSRWLAERFPQLTIYQTSANTNPIRWFVK